MMTLEKKHLLIDITLKIRERVGVIAKEGKRYKKEKQERDWPFLLYGSERKKLRANER